MAAVVSPDAATAAALQGQALQIERFIRHQVSSSCGAFVLSWRALRPISHVIGRQLAADCAALERQIEDFARVVGGLQSGALELCAWQDAPGSFRIGVVKARSVRSDGIGWVIVPVLVIGAAAVGVWVLLDLYLEARALEANAAIKRAELQAQATAAISAAPPSQRDAMAAAIAKANASVAPPNWLTTVGTAIANAADSVGSKVSEAAWPLLLVLLVLLVGRRQR